jgi:hypothetical protein
MQGRRIAKLLNGSEIRSASLLVDEMLLSCPESAFVFLIAIATGHGGVMDHSVQCHLPELPHQFDVGEAGLFSEPVSRIGRKAASLHSRSRDKTHGRFWFRCGERFMSLVSRHE